MSSSLSKDVTAQQAVQSMLGSMLCLLISSKGYTKAPASLPWRSYQFCIHAQSRRPGVRGDEGRRCVDITLCICLLAQALGFGHPLWDTGACQSCTSIIT